MPFLDANALESDPEGLALLQAIFAEPDSPSAGASGDERIAGLALKYALPTVSPYREFAEAGGLMCYGGSNHHTSGSNTSG